MAKQSDVAESRLHLGCWMLLGMSLSGCGSSDASSGPSELGGANSNSVGGRIAEVGGTRSSIGGTGAITTTVVQSLGGAAVGGMSNTGLSTTSEGGSAPKSSSTGGQSVEVTSRGGTQAGGNSSSIGNARGGVPPVGGAFGTNTVNSNGGATSGRTTMQSTGSASTGGKGTGGAGNAATGGKSTSSTSASAGNVAAGGKAVGGANAGGMTTGGSSNSGVSSQLCPAGIVQTITVAKDGSGQFSSVQAAVDSIASGSSAHVRINIRAGTYTEKLTIANRTNLCLVGDAATTTILTYSDSNGSVGSTSGSASVLVSANDFSAAQLTFQNGYGAGSQAVALRTTGQREQFLDCRLVGYQDTLYVHSGTQYFRNCYVQGNTDYVFGGATAILEDCEIRNVQNGSAVAAPNTASTTAYGIVFLGGNFTAVSGLSNVALARPWGADGAAAFLNASLGAHISVAGFTVMSGNDPANARFSEYQSTGSGANASGRSAYQMSASDAAKYTIANIYGGAWTPSYSQ